MYLNRGNHFVDVAKEVGWTRRGNSRGVALVDLDNDGDLDIVVTHQFEPATVYRNDGPDRAWIGLLLRGNGRECSRDAVGTRVVLSVAGVQGTQMREVYAANGFSAQGDRRLLFGLGTRRGPAELAIFWCGATEPQQLTLATGRYHTVSQK